MYGKLLVLAFAMSVAPVASASVMTVTCSQANVNLVMQVEDDGGWIYEAQLYNTVSGDGLGPVDRNDISKMWPDEAFIRIDVQYNATGLFTNCSRH